MPEKPTTSALLARLLQHPLPEIELSLARIEHFLERLGSPHLRLPPVVHVAGTNGKGSLLAYLRAMLEAGGYRCHVYTSPHLVRFNERIVLAGQEISDDALNHVLEHVLAESKHFPMTFFESTTAAAFLAFAESSAEVVLLETGMGGRLDATNVIPHPVLTAITPIAFDHMEFLGNTLARIAFEKAGIMKAGVPCVLGRQMPEALMTLEARAKALDVPLSIYGKNYTSSGTGYASATLNVQDIKPALPGAFQQENAVSAIACAEQLSAAFPLSPEHIRHGIAHARWPARLQRITGGTLCDILGQGRVLWLDGGHNPSAGEAIGQWLDGRGVKAHLVVGMLQGKDAQGFLSPLAPHLASLTAIAIPDEPKTAPPQAIVSAAQGIGIMGETAGSLESALTRISAFPPASGETLIAGSLYLAGTVLAKSRADGA